MTYSTPNLDHLTEKDYEYIYEPAEDTFILLDAIEKECKYLNSLKPLICVEVGSGSGCVSTFLAKILTYPSLIICTDINKYASNASLLTGKENNISLEVITTDILNGLSSRLKNKVDIMIFNPPYVPTETCQVNANSIETSWAGGPDGCQVMKKLFPHIPNLLTDTGVFYLVVIDSNKPEKILKHFISKGLTGDIILKRKCGIETLSVLKLTKKKDLNKLELMS